MGANIDAVQTAGQLGIGADRAVNYQCDSEGTALNYDVVSAAISSVRCSASLSADLEKSALMRTTKSVVVAGISDIMSGLAATH